MVVPSSDWREIDPLHTRMALLRGVENGCSVIRPTHKGLSAAADYQGRILAATDHFRASSRVMVAQVPSRGVWTLYPRLPGLLPVLCLGVLAGTLVARLVRRERG
jgi:apolipoprotein N-acyltransferase